MCFFFKLDLYEAEITTIQQKCAKIAVMLLANVTFHGLIFKLENFIAMQILYILTKDIADFDRTRESIIY